MLKSRMDVIGKYLRLRKEWIGSGEQDPVDDRRRHRLETDLQIASDDVVAFHPSQVPFLDTVPVVGNDFAA